jgi:hypothetical protein
MFAARMIGPHPMFARLDDALRKAAGGVVLGDGQLFTDAAWSRAQLPVRFGGLGLRSSARHAAIAHVSAFFAAMPNVPHIRRALLPDEPGLELVEDAAAAAAAAPASAAPPHAAAPQKPPPVVVPTSVLTAPTCPFVAHFPHVQSVVAHLARTGSLNVGALDKETQDKAKYRSTQHALSALLEREHHVAEKARLRADDLAACARLMSACAPHAGTWLTGVPGVPDESAWLRPEEFVLACRLRLGLAVAPADYKCGLCRKEFSDDSFGHHALTCGSGGMRKFLHDSLVRQFHHVASLALLSPTIECTLPLPHDETSPGTRADVVMPSPDGNGQLWVIDFAVTHIARANAPAHLAAAAAAPGGAATLYEGLKQTRYEAPLNHLNARVAALQNTAAPPPPPAARPVAIHDSDDDADGAGVVAPAPAAAPAPRAPPPPKYVLRPLVVDTHGAWSDNSLKTLQRVGRCWGARTRTRLATRIMMHRLSYVHMRHVSRILLDSASTGAAPPLNGAVAPLGGGGPPGAPAAANNHQHQQHTRRGLAAAPRAAATTAAAAAVPARA